jgi:stage III sporulation protein AH
MKNKRQTIWLVSMLGLMVVLSAYYLFTDDVSEMDFASAEFDAQDIAMNTVEQSELSSEMTLEELTGEELGLEEHSEPLAVNEAKTDEQILQQIEAQATSGQDFFTTMQLQRMESMDKESDRLLKIITDSEQNTEAMNQAYEEMQVIEDELSFSLY